MKIHNVFKLVRNSEYENYMTMLDKVAKTRSEKVQELPSLIET